MVQVLVGLSPTIIAAFIVFLQWVAGAKRRKRTAHRKYGIWN